MKPELIQHVGADVIGGIDFSPDVRIRSTNFAESSR